MDPRTIQTIQMKRWAALLGVLGLLAGACQGDTSGWMAGSQPVDKSIVTTFAGAQHCEMQDATFLVMGWPLGHVELNVSAARWYVRNPPAFVQEELLTDFSASVTPPNDALYTRYHNPTFELWFASSDQDTAAYLKTQGRFERWPRAKQALMCM